MSDFAAFRGGTEGTRSGHGKTAFVFAGGGSFGSIQVGMLRALAAHGVTAEMVVGSSVGAMKCVDSDPGGVRAGPSSACSSRTVRSPATHR